MKIVGVSFMIVAYLLMTAAWLVDRAEIKTLRRENSELSKANLKQQGELDSARAQLFAIADEWGDNWRCVGVLDEVSCNSNYVADYGNQQLRKEIDKRWGSLTTTGAGSPIIRGDGNTVMVKP